MFERLRAPTYPTLQRQVAELEVEVRRLTTEIVAALKLLEDALEALAIAEADRKGAVEAWNKRVVHFRKWRRDALGNALAHRLVDVLDQVLHPSTDPARALYDPGRELSDARKQLAAETPVEQ